MRCPAPWKGTGHLLACKWLILHDHGRPAGPPAASAVSRQEGQASYGAGQGHTAHGALGLGGSRIEGPPRLPPSVPLRRVWDTPSPNQ